MPRTDLLVLTPAFHGNAGGAAIDYRLLGDGLIDRGYRVSVVSDRETGKFRGIYHALLPTRCSRAKRPVRDLLAYAWQNATYLALPGILRRERPRALLLHTSFLNFPGLFPPVLRRLETICRREGVRVVADARDRLMPPARVPRLAGFDGIMACSANVTAHLAANGLEREQISHIPIMQEPLRADRPAAGRLLAELGIGDRPYLFYAGLVKELKGVHLLLEAFVEHVRPSFPDVELVVAGLLKTSNPGVLERLRAPGVRYLGDRPREDILHLTSRADLCVCASPNEGQPRACLEALGLGRPVLLPPNVPEFARHCPDFVVEDLEPERLGAQIGDLLRSGKTPGYPIHEHHPDRVLPRYLDVLGLA